MDARRAFKECGSLHEPELGQDLPYHFISDARHTAGYFSVGPLQRDPRLVWQATEALAKQVPDGVDVVLTTSIPPNPTFGYLMSLNLLRREHGQSVQWAWAWPRKHHTSKYALEDRVIRFISGKSVLVLHGVIGDPAATRELVGYVGSIGGNPVGVAAFAVDARIQPEMLDVQNLFSLYQFGFESWAEGECQESGPCAREVPIVTNYGMGAGYSYRTKHAELPQSRFVAL